MDWKGIVKIIIGLLVVAGIIWGGYFLWQKFVSEPQTSPIGGAASEEPKTFVDLPAPQKLSNLTKNPVLDYWVNSLTGSIYYLNSAGQVVRKSGSNEETVNSQIVNDFNSLKPSPDGTLAAVKFNYPNSPLFSVFNTITNSWQPLPPATLAIAWAANSQQLAYLESKGNAGSLKILNFLSQKTEEVAKLNQKEATLDWIQPSEIYLTTALPTAELVASMWSVNLKNKTWRPLIQNEVGLTINWSLKNGYGLKLSSFQRQPKITLIDSLANPLKEFTFKTLPEKCAFDGGLVYCAVPRFISGGLTLPDDYYKKSVYFQDDFYAIDIATGNASSIFSEDESLIDAHHLTVHDNQLFFVNRYDDKLYSLRL